MWHVKIKALIGIIALSLYAIQADDQHHGIRCNFGDDRLLGVQFKELVTRPSE